LLDKNSYQHVIISYIAAPRQDPITNHELAVTATLTELGDCVGTVTRLLREHPFHLPIESRLTMALWGLVGETGELWDYWKKVVYHGHKLEPEVLLKEAGDLLWYINVAQVLVDRLAQSERSFDVLTERLERVLKEIEGIVERLITLHNSSLEQEYAANVAKIASRYPKGHFSSVDSANRVEYQL